MLEFTFEQLRGIVSIGCKLVNWSTIWCTDSKHSYKIKEI